ncbi:MAG: methyltransferase domain-containing protein [Phycisphaerales bacterium]|nr:methyltransferase domain-containing protein [Phycisphaerales bacterium]MCB9857144.1 methyltransferase domain-containing protein [Phycisphaerales bacterium]MCB9861729.1 methyltransferase domain-containing protein [Phycisphaerales bacterium]
MAESIPAESTREVSAREGYDLWSTTYDEADNPLVKLEGPVVEAALGEVAGLKILDLGCGTGRHSLRLAGAGAEVTAMDFSEGMLAKAREKALGRIDFVVGDLHQRLPFEDEAFDRVICCLVFDHIRDVAGVLSEMRRVCRLDGFILITTLHPAMLLTGVQARFTDAATGEKVLLESVQNQVSDYVNASVAAALRIRSMSEYFVDDALTARSPNAEKYAGWPLLLTMTFDLA